MGGVTVICPNNHRVIVKFEGNAKTIFQILEEACKKQGFLPEKYGLKHHNRFVDLSLTFRMSGLPMNCALEMAELPQEQQQGKPESEDVQVALQMSDGQRFTSTIPSNATLLDLLLDFEKISGMKLVEPESDVENMQPVCHYLHNEFIGCLALSSTTLKQLGIRGRALFRYAPRQVDPAKLQEVNDAIERSRAKMRKLEVTYEKKLQDNLDYEREQQRRKQEEEALEQLRQQQIDLQMQTSTSDVAMNESAASIPSASPDTQPKSSHDAHTSRQARLDALQSMLAMVDQSIDQGTNLPWDVEPRQQQPSAQAMAGLQEFKFPEETKGMDLSSKYKAVTGAGGAGVDGIEPCERNTLAFSLSDFTEVATEEPPPEFFDVTVEDMKAMLRDIKEQSEERTLLPDSYIRQKDFERKLQAWKVTVLRIRMPDRMVLQGTFRTLETVDAVYRFVKENLRDRNVQFELRLPPNVPVDKRDRNLLQAGLAPRASLLYRQISDYSHEDGYLSVALLEGMKTPAEADRVAEECLAVNTTFVPYRPSASGESVQRQPQQHQPQSQTEYRPRNRNDTPKDALPKWLSGMGKK